MGIELPEPRPAEIIRLAPRRLEPRPERVEAAPAAALRAVALEAGASAAAAAAFLERHGFEVAWANSPDEAAEIGSGAELIVAALDLRCGEGLELCRRLAEAAPLLVVSGRAEIVDRVTALEFGADEVLAEDCHPLELIARARAVVRRALPRAGAAAAPVNPRPAWSLDERRRELSAPGRAPVRLTETETRVLEALFTAPGQTLTRGELKRRIYGRPLPSRSVDAVVCRLRGKLRQHGVEFLINSVRGVGYALHL